jgi:Gluconolactonase
MKANLLYRCYDTIGEAVTWLPDMKTLLWVDIDSGILHQLIWRARRWKNTNFPK